MNNVIGLTQDDSARLRESLNDLLANYSVLYMNTRGYHWNIKGKDFFELHLKFEEIYNELVLQIDEIAERILTLGGTPTHSYSDYIAKSYIKEDINQSNGSQALQSLLSAYQLIIEKQREILKLASDTNDEGTLSQISDYIQLQEKHVWMFRAYLT
jgi:starvation-inducible DNA-binding protein